jgi:high affinity sulfate transporter 1
VADLNAGGNTGSAVSLSAALALFTGVAFLAVGLVRLGWVANFMSKTVIQGFVIGLSISIIIGQLDDLLGIEVSGDNSFEELGSVLSQIGDWDQATVVAGAVSLTLLFGMERYVKKLPAALTVVVLSVFYISTIDPAGVAIVGEIPQGLPDVGVPDFSSSQIGSLIAGGMAVALVGFSEGYGAASSFARKYGDRLENNQEFIAFGVSNVGAGLTSGMVVGGSLAKTAANDAAKAKSQISNVVDAVLVVLTLLFLAPFFENLAEATLAAIVIAALWHSADPRKLAPVWKVTRVEFWLAVVVLVAVLALDTLPAIALGVIISLVLLIYHMSFPNTAELRRDQETGSFESRVFHEDAEPVPGVVVYRFEAPLIYANAGSFGDAARDPVDAADPSPQLLVVDCEEMFTIDYTGTQALEGLVEDMRERDIEVRLARVQHRVLERLRTSGVLGNLGEERLFRRVERTRPWSIGDRGIAWGSSHRPSDAQHPNPLHQQEDARDHAPDPDGDPHRRRLSVPGEEQDGPQANLDGPEDEPADRPTMPGSLFDFESPHQPETPGRNRRQGDAADEGLWTHDIVERTATEQHQPQGDGEYAGSQAEPGPRPPPDAEGPSRRQDAAEHPIESDEVHEHGLGGSRDQSPDAEEHGETPTEHADPPEAHRRPHSLSGRGRSIRRGLHFGTAKPRVVVHVVHIRTMGVSPAAPPVEDESAPGAAAGLLGPFLRVMKGGLIACQWAGVARARGPSRPPKGAGPTPVLRSARWRLRQGLSVAGHRDGHDPTSPHDPLARPPVVIPQG